MGPAVDRTPSELRWLVFRAGVMRWRPGASHYLIAFVVHLPAPPVGSKTVFLCRKNAKQYCMILKSPIHAGPACAGEKSTNANLYPVVVALTPPWSPLAPLAFRHPFCETSPRFFLTQNAVAARIIEEGVSTPGSKSLSLADYIKVRFGRDMLVYSYISYNIHHTTVLHTYTV